MVLRDVHGLLRGPSALDRAVREGEDGISGLEVFQRRIGFEDVVRVVVGADPRSLERFRQALDLVVVELQPHRDDQVLVADDVTLGGGQLVRVRIELYDLLLDPVGSFGENIAPKTIWKQSR